MYSRQLTRLPHVFVAVFRHLQGSMSGAANTCAVTDSNIRTPWRGQQGKANVSTVLIIKKPATKKRQQSAHSNFEKSKGNPQIIHFNRVFHCKPSILGISLSTKRELEAIFSVGLKLNSRLHQFMALLFIGSFQQLPGEAAFSFRSSCINREVSSCQNMMIWMFPNGL